MKFTVLSGGRKGAEQRGAWGVSSVRYRSSSADTSLSIYKPGTFLTSGAGTVE